MHLLDFKDNPLALDAIYIITETDKNVFLTGNAGTGKSTLLRQIIANITKRTIVLAPSGVAALNVGGSTIHSFFQLNPKIVFSPEFDIPHNYYTEKIELFNSIELLVIDEVSMLRADTVDYFDSILRRYRKKNVPFGGVQLLLVGDLNQLPPIVTKEEKQLFNSLYLGSFFFHSNVFQSIELLTIKLEKPYRQQDPVFINLLNKIRENTISDIELERINWRVCESPQNEAIILTTKNDIAGRINLDKLNSLDGAARIFKSKEKGEIKEIKKCAEEILKLKIGARVMFLNNDYYKRWVNGSMGKVTGFNNNNIQVTLDSGDIVDVQEHTWENIEYKVDKALKKLQPIYKGEFIQFPLRLAWAITIHKSQGLTFNQVIIDIGSGSWLSGQTYVALSRCISLEGIFLKTPIRKKDILLDLEVVIFSKRANNESIFRTSELAKSIRRLRLNTSMSNSSSLQDILNSTSELYNIAKDVKEKFEYLAKITYCEYLLGDLDAVDKSMAEIRKYRVLAKIFGHQIFELFENIFKINRNNNLNFNQIKQLSETEYFIKSNLFHKIFFTTINN
jgi:ATP-dependent exoDNAse (exonuclease V), alpha subunit - helicase superfamily I member